MAIQAAGSKGGHYHWTLEGACPDTGRRHYERLYQDDVVLSPTFYRPEHSASEAERTLCADMLIINAICKQKSGFDRLMRAFADASGGPRGDVVQLETAMKSVQMQGVGRDTIKYIAFSCQMLFGLECRESFTLSQCAVIAEKFFQNRRLLPAAQVADCSAHDGSSRASAKVHRQATDQVPTSNATHGAQPPLYTSRSHGDILSWKHGGTERSHFDGLIPQTPPIPQ
jgi:hypothetical protein